MQKQRRSASTDPDTPPLPLLAMRGAIGGVLMGLANLVPGISGGTMLLAAGVYPRFINAIGEITTLKFRKPSLLLLGSVIVAALMAIVLFAGPVKDLVVHHRWIMYSLFIGLTLGGVPVVWRLIQIHTSGMWAGAAAGFLGMAALAYVQTQGNGGVHHEGFAFMLFAGAAGASAMILPGVSGGYLLLVLGVYVPILAGISAFKDAVKAGDTDTILSVGTGVILPVGLGVVVGVVVISNLLKWLLDRHEKPTLGVLLGLLLGAVVGLWPFQQGIAPEVGSLLKGQTVVVDDTGSLAFGGSGKAVEPDDYPTEIFSPTAVQVTEAAGLVVVGFLITLLVDRIGGSKKAGPPGRPDTTHKRER